MDLGGAPIPSLQRLVSGNSWLLASGSIETRPLKYKRSQTSMLLILRFAESSNASESIFAPGTGGSLRQGWGCPREARPQSVVTGTCRLKAGPDRWTVSTLREDGVVALEAEAY
ncbi:MAG: hypothetical protein ACE5JO_06745 [Candidatus Binatia bacterium]